MFNFLNKLLGTKSDRDIKHVMPIVEAIKQAGSQLETVSNDELRQQTLSFKERIKEYLSEIDEQLQALDVLANKAAINVEEKSQHYEAIDKLQKERGAGFKS